MSVLIANNASTILASNITSSQTTIPLNTGTGALFPSPAAPDFFYGTLQSASNPSQVEIVRVTSRSGDSLTVVRGQDGTTAQAFNVSDIFALLPTRATESAIRNVVSLPTSTGSANAQSVTNTVPIAVLGKGATQSMIPGFANTGPWTLAVDGLPASPVFVNGAACAGGEVQPTVPMDLEFDGTNWNLLNPALPTKNYIVDPCCRMAQNQAVASLTTAYKYGVVDLVQAKGAGTAVSAGTITQDTAFTVAGAATAYSCKLAGVTITGTGKVLFRRWIESSDAVQYKNKTVLFSVLGFQDTGGAINGFLTINKPTAQNNFSSVTNIGVGSTVSVPSSTTTEISCALAVGDCSNGLEIILEMDCGAVTTKDFYATDWQACVNTLPQTCVVPPIGEDTVNAFRYFQVIGVNQSAGDAPAVVAYFMSQSFPVPMIAPPTFTLGTINNNTNISGSPSYQPSSANSYTYSFSTAAAGVFNSKVSGTLADARL